MRIGTTVYRKTDDREGLVSNYQKDRAGVVVRFRDGKGFWMKPYRIDRDKIETKGQHDYRLARETRSGITKAKRFAKALRLPYKTVQAILAEENGQ